MTTAVNGSKAPIMAAGVEPTSRMETFINTKDNIVGRTASIKANIHSLAVVKTCKCVSLSNMECKKSQKPRLLTHKTSF